MMFGLRARWRLALANADFERCKDEWDEAEARQDTRRMASAGTELRAARARQIAAELAVKPKRKRPGGQVTQ